MQKAIAQFCEARNAKLAAVADPPALLATMPPSTVAFAAQDGRQAFVVDGSRALIPLSVVSDFAASLSPEQRSAPRPALCYEVMRVKHGGFLFGAAHEERLLRSIGIAFAGCRAPPVDDSAPSLGVSSSKNDEFADLLRSIADVKDFTRTLIEEHPDVGKELPAVVGGFVENNVKVAVWCNEGAQEAPASSNVSSVDEVRAKVNVMLSKGQLSSIAFYIDSVYPPDPWYQPGPSTVEFDGKKGGLGGCDMAVLYGAARKDPNAKAMNAEMTSIRERAKALQEGASVFEVLLCDDEGIVPEGSRSNIFVVKDGSLIMAPDADVLVGCTRLAVNRICSDRKIPIVKRPVHLGDVLSADAVVMTGTSPGVLPVRRIMINRDGCAEAGAQSILEKALSSVQGHVAAGASQLVFDSARHPIVAQLVEAYNASAST